MPLIGGLTRQLICVAASRNRELSSDQALRATDLAGALTTHLLEKSLMHTPIQRAGTVALRASEPNPNELLDCKSVCELFGGIHPATLYRGIRKGRYPPPIHVGPNTSRWVRSECEAALAAMIARRAAQ